jgi:hydrogenase maturation protease
MQTITLSTKKDHKLKLLVYGYGNPGRQDDGLGNLFVDEAQKWAEAEGLKNISFDSNYQLNIEDAANISEHDVVIFVDASIEDISDFLLTELKPNAKVEFSMHSVSPAFVVHLCKDIYPTTPLAFLLHLKGYEWEFKEGITRKAFENFSKAFEYMKPLLKSPDLIIKKFEKK